MTGKQVPDGIGIKGRRCHTVRDFNDTQDVGTFWWEEPSLHDPNWRCHIRFPGAIGAVSTGKHQWDGEFDAPTFRNSILVMRPERTETGVVEVEQWHGWMTGGVLHEEAPKSLGLVTEV